MESDYFKPWANLELGKHNNPHTQTEGTAFLWANAGGAQRGLVMEGSGDYLRGTERILYPLQCIS